MSKSPGQPASLPFLKFSKPPVPCTLPARTADRLVGKFDPMPALFSKSSFKGKSRAVKMPALPGKVGTGTYISRIWDAACCGPTLGTASCKGSADKQGRRIGMILRPGRLNLEKDLCEHLGDAHAFRRRGKCPVWRCWLHYRGIDGAERAAGVVGNWVLEIGMIQ
jgi:hypothetical protein